MHERKIVRSTLAVLLLVLLVSGGGVSSAAPQSQAFARTNDTSLPFLTLSTTGLATGPQLALWRAIEQGRILEKCNIRVRLWNNLDELRKTLLAGEADLWVGHTDVFVEAALQGAPVQLLLTTGWRKFYLLSSNPQTLRFSNFIDKPLAVTPPGSPAVSVLRALGEGEFGGISFTFDQPQTLLKKLVQGKTTAALLPEPLATRALFANPKLMVGENVAELYTRQTGQRRGMPIAGIAVNTETAEKYPEIIAWIAKETMKQAETLAASPQAGVKDLPLEFQAFIAKEVVETSLERERLDAAYSEAVRPEILQYLRILFSSSKETVPSLPANLFWKRKSKAQNN